MRLRPDLLFPVTVNKRGVLNGLPSQETTYSPKGVSGDILDTRHLDVRIMADKWSNFSISTGCGQQTLVKRVNLLSK
jgi:hypothetical protein